MTRMTNINQMAEFVLGSRTKKDIFKGEHFNVVLICLDSGAVIPPHEEPYDVFFYVISGRGVFLAGQQQWEAEDGSMIFVPKGIRAIQCIERLTILGVQEPH